MRFKVDSLRLEVKPGNRASAPTQQEGGQAEQDGGQARGRSSHHGGQATEEAPKARRSQGRFRGVGRPTLQKPFTSGFALQTLKPGVGHPRGWSCRPRFIGAAGARGQTVRLTQVQAGKPGALGLSAGFL
jgi:hypothetical protein